MMRLILTCLLVVLITGIQPAPADTAQWVEGEEPEILLWGVSLGPAYVFQRDNDGAVKSRKFYTTVDRSMTIAQADFTQGYRPFWIRSTLEELLPDEVRRLPDRTVVLINTQGGVGWRHWALDIHALGVFRWTVEVGLAGDILPHDTQTFYIERKPR